MEVISTRIKMSGDIVQLIRTSFLSRLARACDFSSSDVLGWMLRNCSRLDQASVGRTSNFQPSALSRDLMRMEEDLKDKQYERAQASSGKDRG